MKQLDCILFIDDNQHTNFLNKRLVNKLALARNVFAVSNGKEGLDFLTNQGSFVQNGTKYPKPGLIFLDINMPVMDGWEFLQNYRNLDPQQKGDVMIIMLTTSPNPDDMAKAVALPEVNGFERKPLSAEMMLNIMNKYFA